MDQKLKRRIDWYMDIEDFIKFQKLAFQRGFPTVQKLIKKILEEEWVRQQIKIIDNKTNENNIL